MRVLWLALPAVLAWAGPSDTSAQSGKTIVIPDCKVSLLDECVVPAQEAGILVELSVKEGDHVEQDKSLLAKVNDSKAQAARRVAKAEFDVASAEAENDVDRRYAEKAAEVYYAVYQKMVAANKGAARAVSEVDLILKKLEFERAELQIEQAVHKTHVDELTRDAKQAQVDAADDDIRRRRIVAPISGEVVEVHPHAGEWVNPGDPVVHIVNLERLRVQASVSASQFAPEDLEDRTVTVRVERTQGQVVSFNGKIVFVNKTVRLADKYPVFVEVDNRQENGAWLLLPGQSAEITISTELAARPTPTRRRGSAVR